MKLVVPLCPWTSTLASFHSNGTFHPNPESLLQKHLLVFCGTGVSNLAVNLLISAEGSRTD